MSRSSFGPFEAHSACVLVAICALSCGGKSDQPGPPDQGPDAADLDALCDDVCDRQASCGEEPSSSDPPCRTECASDRPRLALVRRDVLQALGACIADLSCDESDDRCAEQVLTEFVPDFEALPLLQKCVRVQDDCGGFSDDLCSTALAFTRDGQAQLDACLSSSCALVGPCVEALGT